MGEICGMPRALDRNLRLVPPSMNHSLVVLALALTIVFSAALAIEAQTYTVLYTFEGGSDGGYPVAGLLPDRLGNLYGTTLVGGAGDCVGGCGVVYKLTPYGEETVLHSFNHDDGAMPSSTLIAGPNHTLYGTTELGGSDNNGVVFALDASGNETVVHSFDSSSGDVSYPEVGLVLDPEGNLFGAASFSQFGYGAVFKLDPSGNETLYPFNGTDGNYPRGDLIRDSKENLYGTTWIGGLYDYGEIFSLDSQSGIFRVLHNFNEFDGSAPTGRLTADKQGNLYGTTEGGGAKSYGVVYKLSLLTARFTILHSFSRDADGGGPSGGVVLDKTGNLYGTTVFGGAYDAGVIFRIDPSGNFSVLFNFSDLDGIGPTGNLIQDDQGALYGTTFQGGRDGSGTVFKFVP